MDSPLLARRSVFVSSLLFSSIPPPTSTIEKCRPEALSPPSEREEPTDGRTDVCVHSPLACMGSWAVSCRWFLKAKPRGNEAGSKAVYVLQRPQSFDDVFSLGDDGNPSEFSHEVIGNSTQPMRGIGAATLPLSPFVPCAVNQSPPPFHPSTPPPRSYISIEPSI